MSPPQPRTPAWYVDELGERSVLRVARRRLVVISLLAGLLLSAVATLAIDRVATVQAEDHARSEGEAVARAVAAVLEAEPTDVGAVAQTVAGRRSVDHVLVWQADGVVRWSDDPAFTGRAFALDAELRELFSTTGSVVGRASSDLESADPPAGADEDFEVFTPVTVDGTPLVVETYVDRSVLDEQRRGALLVLLPHALAALVVVELGCLVPGALMLRQLRRSRAVRTRLTTAALRAMETERRELAHQLHDGVVQDLAATRYAISAVADSLEHGEPGRPRETLERVQEILGEELLDLRGLLGHLVPPDLESRALDQALRALVRHLVPPETRCHLRYDCPELDTDDARVVYRVVREGVVNAVRHGRAGRIDVEVAGDAADAGRTRDVVVTVSDDGIGLDSGVPPAEASGGPADDAGHFGLDLLRSLVGDHGGELRLRAGEGGGAVLRARLPLGRAARLSHSPV